jgi:hypothetical protein
MPPLVPVSFHAYYAAHRGGYVSGLGGRVVRVGGTSEFVTSGGEVLCRKITPVAGQPECWLRVDLADAAAEFLIREQAEDARVAAEVISWSLGRDQQRADEHGMTLEAYRQKRNAQLARIDQRRGRQNIGM